MNLDELFDTTARLGEPELPRDVLGRVRHAQARRRRAQLIALPIAAAAVAAAVLVPTVLRQPGATTTPPATRPTQRVTQAPAPEPAVLVALAGSRAVQVEVSSGRRTDLGPAHAVSTRDGQPWLSRPRAACRDVIVGPKGTSFDAGGEVSSLAVSPDGKTVAYSRASGPASPDYPDMRCSARALVLRDLVSGDERTWASGEGSVSTIAWSADGTRLGFIEHPCCGDDDPLAFVVDAAAAPSGLDQLPPVVNPASDRGYCTTRAVVFVDDHVLLGHECASPTGTSDSVLVDASSGDLVATLPQSATGICVDRSGRHLLVEGHVPGSAPGTRALFSVDTESKTSRLLYDALSGGAW